MPVIPLLNGTDKTKSVDQNSANLINMYLVNADGQDKYPTAAYYTPGLTVFVTINSPVRAVLNVHGTLYAIGGNTVYTIASNGTATSIGTIGTSTGFAKLKANNTQIFIIDGLAGYMYDIPSLTFSTIASDTYVSSLVMTAPGSGYSASPTAVFTGGSGSDAAATVTVLNGQITGLTLTNTGTGYTSPPTIQFTDPSGTGATATAYTTTSTFTNTMQDSECQDEFGVGVGLNGQVWYSSNVSDLKTWPATSFASSTGNQNNLVAIVSCHRELYLLGQSKTEVWYNAGTPYFTWARRSDTFIEYGCAAKQSVTQADNTIFFLGQNTSGGVVVIRMNGYSPQVISNRSINYQLSTYTTVSDAIGIAYQQEGHEFYALTFPTANVTWVYDITEQVWHQRQSGSGRWLANCYSFCYAKQLIGDYNSGNIYQLDMTNYQENGSSITRTIITQPYYQAGVQIYCDKLQIDFDQTPGSGLSAVNLYVSRDGGNTYGTAKAATPFQTSDGQWRCYWNRLGRARTFVFKITTTINGKFIVLGAWATFRLGTN